MAKDRPGGEPTEEPTPHRLEQARKEGQIARSRDLSGAVIFWAGVGALLGSIVWIASGVVALARTCFQQAGHLSAHATAAVGSWAMARSLRFAAPVLGAAFVGALLAGAAQARGLFTLKPLTPKLASMNPLEGLKRMFGGQALFQLAKNVIVFLVAGWMAYSLAKDAAWTVVRLEGADPAATASAAWLLAKGFLYRLGALFLLVGAADFAYNYRKHKKGLMMTKYEVMQEMKQQEGDPQHKAKRRQFHQEILEGAMLQAVEGADMVVVNPTRLAVALRYRRGEDAAPVVVAKGRNVLARKIREVARRAGVPIFRDVPLARALWDLELDSEIPEELYEAVAALLRVVEQERAGD